MQLFCDVSIWLEAGTEDQKKDNQVYLHKSACDRLCIYVHFVADSIIFVKLFTSCVYYYA